MIAAGRSGPTVTMPCCGSSIATASPSAAARAWPSAWFLIRPPVRVKRGMSG